VLLNGIPNGFVNGLALAPAPLDQFTLDLVRINKVARMERGIVPLVVLLKNSAERLKLLGIEEAAVFERYASKVGNVSEGVPPLPNPAALPEVISNEKIIGFDDSLDMDFLSGGLEIAKAVALVAVPRFEGGTQIMVSGGPWVLRGTAWLIAPNLALTNHHVINSRLDREAPANDADFGLQALGSSLQFDFDAPVGYNGGAKATVGRLVASSAQLDYALLELTGAPQRPIPAIAPTPVTLDPTTRMAVNIVQHPRGEYKRVAVRNNLVSAADATSVRYFTDTDYGSSGSPVCDDGWRVVALHRGAQRVTDVQFQGKPEAYVNFGSQIQAVLADIATKDQAAANAIAAGQGNH